MARRLAPQPLEWIDRSRRLRFQFEGDAIEGFAGDVVSSAVLATDRMLLGRSFKYHRPRSVLSMANHDSNVLLETPARTNIRGDVEAAEDGAAYRAVNTVGGLYHDVSRVVELLAPLLPVGFYYKAFYRPRALFPFWERLIRRAAGLGRVNTTLPAARQPRTYRHCDVLVIGGGPAGLAAAQACARTGAEVILADENRRLGGTLDYQHTRNPEAQAFKRTALATLGASPRATLLTETFAAGYYDEGYVPLAGPAGLVQVQAGRVIFATGLMEQPAVFRHNDLPGVMLASAAQRLVHRFAVAPFDQAVVLAGNDDAYHCAIDLHTAGLAIAAIVDLDDPVHRGAVVQEVMARGIQVVPHAHVHEAVGGRDGLREIRIRANDGGTRQTIHCDGLLMSVGWAPAASLLHQAGGRLDYDAALGQVIPAALPPGIYAAGRVNGVFDLGAQLEDGEGAAAQACSGPGLKAPVRPRPARAPLAHSHPYPIHEHPRGKNFIDFDEDIQTKDLRIGVREGFDSIELLKRYSTIGMSPSQGKTSNMNGVRFLAALQDRPVPAIGVTTPRPFFHPVPMGMLAGRRLRRQWCTPMHEQHLAQHAQMMEAGSWLRPRTYARGPGRATAEAEYRAVRAQVGMIDVSTLGKIELFGRDAAALLEYAYTCTFDKLADGGSRYIFMVDGSGTIVDDGVAARCSDDHYYITATTSHAQAVVRQLQCYADQLDLEVTVIDRTFQLGALNLAGPRARQVLRRVTDLDLGETAFPYLAFRNGTVAGIPARLLRVGFVGELGYEIHVPAHQAAHLWEALLAAGREDAITPFGVETQRLLRLEKGHIIIGQDTDGTTNPFEANLGWGVRLSKPRFVGKHSLELLKSRVARRLVGFRCAEPPSSDGIDEAHLIIDGGRIRGRVTSVAFSPVLGTTIGLAVVDTELAGAGGELNVRTSSGRLVTVTVASTPFYDPDNARQKIDDDGEVVKHVQQIDPQALT